MFKKSVSRRQAIKTILTASAATPVIFGPTPIAFAESAGFSTAFIASRPELKILAVTDLHFFWRTTAHDILTVDLLKKLVKRFQPDLLVVDGDSWNNHFQRISDYMVEFTCDHLSSLGVPWAFVRGNHDLVTDFNLAEDMIHAAPNSLYPAGHHNANYRIDVKSASGGIPLRLLILNDSAPETGFTEKVIARMSAEIDNIKAGPDPDAPVLLFTHIPMPAFEDMVREGKARGVMFEKVCHDGATPDSLAAIRETGIVKAVFCGHDHVNCYKGLMDGVHLEYVRASGFGGYGVTKVEKGGTLITVPLDGSGNFTSVSVLPSGETPADDSIPTLVTGE